jgi:hypothetical protein
MRQVHLPHDRQSGRKRTKNMDPMTIYDDATDWFELGHALFRTDPEMLGAAVWRHASRLSASREDQFNFVSGYGTARRQHDDYQREKSNAVQG